MIDYQELAERLAMESIVRFGFVVCGYLPDEKCDIGSKTDFLWRRFKMPQPFVVAREATPEEWRRQCDLFREIVGTNPHPSHLIARPMVMVTD